MASQRKAALLLAMGICASIVLAVNAQVEPGSASFEAHATGLAVEGHGEVEDTASEDLELATLWKKAVKLGKCIYMRKLVECSHNKNGDYGYGSDGYSHKSKPYKSKNSYTKKNAHYVIDDTPDYTTSEETDSYDSDSYTDSSKYKSAGKKKSHKKSKKVVEEVEEVEEESSTATEEESSSGGDDSGEYAPAPAPTPSPKKNTYSTKNKKKDSYKKSDADADDSEEASGSEEALVDDSTTEDSTDSNTDSGTYGDSGNTEGEAEEESGGETNISPDSIWDYGWGGSDNYGSRPWRDVERKVRVPKHSRKGRKGKWHMAYHL